MMKENDNLQIMMSKYNGHNQIDVVYLSFVLDYP